MRTLSDLASQAYDVALAESEWPRYLEGIADYFDSASVSLSGGGPEIGCSIAIMRRVDPSVVRDYNDYYGSINVYNAGMHAGVRYGMAFTGRQIVEDRALVRTEYYNDWLRPAGMHHMLAAPLFGTGATTLLGFCVWRPATTPAYSAAEMRDSLALAKHLRTALQVQRRFRALESQGQQLAAHLDDVADGVLLVDGRARVLVANAEARRILALRDGLLSRPEGLVASRSADTARLHALIAKTAGHHEWLDRGGALVLPRPSCRRAFQLLVSPLRGLPVHGCRDAAAVVFLVDPEASPSPPRNLARFALTPAEQRFSAAFLQTRSVALAAEQLQVTTATARTHLKRIFRKTGARRQSELVRALQDAR